MPTQAGKTPASEKKAAAARKTKTSTKESPAAQLALLRAKKLSKKRRSEIAKKAADRRWELERARRKTSS